MCTVSKISFPIMHLVNHAESKGEVTPWGGVVVHCEEKRILLGERDTHTHRWQERFGEEEKVKEWGRKRCIQDTFWAPEKAW